MTQTARKPTRLAIAQAICRKLPPIIAQRLHNQFLYPYPLAVRDDYPFVTVSPGGIKFRGNTADPHAYSFGVTGYYEWRNLAVARAVCRPGDTIIEVGANVGTETVGFADIVGRGGQVFAFEPVPSNLAFLRETLALNPELKITIFPNAVGDSCTSARFSAPANRSSSGMGHLATCLEAEPSGAIEVDCVTLDSLARQLGRARMIAIDVEGFEVGVLRGAHAYIRQARPVILLEAAPNWLERAGTTLGDLHRILADLGYEIKAIGKLGLQPIELTGNAKESNWLCIHRTEVSLFPQVANSLLSCGLLPCIAGVNPIFGRTCERASA